MECSISVRGKPREKITIWRFHPPLFQRLPAPSSLFQGQRLFRIFPSIIRNTLNCSVFYRLRKCPGRKVRRWQAKSRIYTMRQASDGAHLIGAATNEKERVLQIPMSFLPKGTFVAQVIQDEDTA